MVNIGIVCSSNGAVVKCPLVGGGRVPSVIVVIRSTAFAVDGVCFPIAESAVVTPFCGNGFIVGRTLGNGKRTGSMGAESVSPQS